MEHDRGRLGDQVRRSQALPNAITPMPAISATRITPAREAEAALRTEIGPDYDTMVGALRSLAVPD